MSARHQKMFMDPAHRRALLAHDRKYEISAVVRRKLAIAWETLSRHDVALKKAMDEATRPRPNTEATSYDKIVDVRGGLRILVEGPNGEFR